jgi:hypothetical protein
LSWYRTGTVAVTNGAKTVTGVGTLFTTAVNAGDAFALVDANLNPTGAWYEVESVANNTTLVLKQSYAGSTGSNKQYCVFNLVGNMTTPSFAQRLSTFFASFQNLIDKPTTTPTASSIPVADSGGKIADGWIPATVARLESPTLTGSPTAPTQAASDSSTKIATTAHVKGAISSVVELAVPLTSATNWDDLPDIYLTRGVAVAVVDGSITSNNRPPSPVATYHYVMHVEYSSPTKNLTQIAIPYKDNQDFFVRSKFGGVWTAWKKIYDQGNILGTVSQSGGVPTGAVIERGSNANGSYVKFADGTVICTQTISRTDMDIPAGQALYRTSEWTLPVSTTFSNKMFISASVRNMTIDKLLYTAVVYIDDNYACLWNTGGSPVYVAPGDAVRGIGYSPSNKANTMTLQLLAIGRWF